MRIIAVDFDGTLCRGKWPEIGDANEDIIRALINSQKDGAKLILWTCREGDDLKAAVMWCMKHGLRFDAINDNLEENKEYFGNNSRKVYATEYWDDKNVTIVHANGKYATVRADDKQVAVVQNLPAGKSSAFRRNWSLKGWWKMLWR